MNDGGSQTTASESELSADTGVVYELEIEGQESPSQAADLAPAEPAPSHPSDPRDREIAELRQAHADTVAQLTPWLAHLRAQQQNDLSKPPFNLDELDTNANLKPSDLVKYLEWQRGQDLARLRAESQFAARATLSETTARGQFSAAALGEGNDYDTMTNRYVAPLIAQNPAVDALIATVFPRDPGAGRMLVATLIAAVDRAGGDLVKGVKAVLDGVGAYQQGAQETRQSLSRAAAARAANVLPGSKAGSRPTTKKISSADDVWNMTESQYANYRRQHGWQ